MANLMRQFGGGGAGGNAEGNRFSSAAFSSEESPFFGGPAALVDADPDEAAFAAALRGRGLRLKTCVGDGACLFRAVSHQVYGTEEHHPVVRQSAVEHMRRHHARFSQHCVGDALPGLRGPAPTDFNGYLVAMSQPGVFGGHPELQALSEIYNRPVEVYGWDAARRALVREGERRDLSAGGRVNEANPPLVLSHFGGMHYDSLMGARYDEGREMFSFRAAGSHEQQAIADRQFSSGGDGSAAHAPAPPPADNDGPAFLRPRRQPQAAAAAAAASNDFLAFPPVAGPAGGSGAAGLLAAFGGAARGGANAALRGVAFVKDTASPVGSLGGAAPASPDAGGRRARRSSPSAARAAPPSPRAALHNNASSSSYDDDRSSAQGRQLQPQQHAQAHGSFLPDLGDEGLLGSPDFFRGRKRGAAGAGAGGVLAAMLGPAAAAPVHHALQDQEGLGLAADDLIGLNTPAKAAPPGGDAGQQQQQQQQQKQRAPTPTSAAARRRHGGLIGVTPLRPSRGTGGGGGGGGKDASQGRRRGTCARVCAMLGFM
jgi:hypothetical protein